MENSAFGRNKNSLILSLITLLTLIPLLLGLLFRTPAPDVLGNADLQKTPAAVMTTSSTVTDSVTGYQVVSVVDGDTIKINIDGKTTTVRLIGIDSPETNDPRKSVQCFGKEAGVQLEKILQGKKVTIAFDPTQNRQDKYGRLLLYIWADGLFVNEYMVKQGFAHEYTYNVPYQYQQEFRADEAYARENNLGLWGKCPNN